MDHEPLASAVSDRASLLAYLARSSVYGNLGLFIGSGVCVAIGPNEVPSVRKGRIPCYHLHGVRTAPQSLVVTEEDYVRLFRPADYRQTKLATLLKESVTLVLGYGLGDVACQTGDHRVRLRLVEVRAVRRRMRGFIGRAGTESLPLSPSTIAALLSGQSSSCESFLERGVVGGAPQNLLLIVPD